ncbi:MAG: GNAT family N-acetyltransferase [Bacillota bacterium]
MYSRKKNLNKSGSIYAIYVDNQIVATASVISETKTHAVINGVTTHVNHRKKGYAKALVDQIINDYIGERKMGLILYYDNLNAQKIYKRRGFIDANIWTSINLYSKYSNQRKT